MKKLAEKGSIPHHLIELLTNCLTELLAKSLNTIIFNKIFTLNVLIYCCVPDIGTMQASVKIHHIFIEIPF